MENPDDPGLQREELLDVFDDDDFDYDFDDEFEEETDEEIAEAEAAHEGDFTSPPGFGKVPGSCGAEAPDNLTDPGDEEGSDDKSG